MTTMSKSRRRSPNGRPPTGGGSLPPRSIDVSAPTARERLGRIERDRIVISRSDVDFLQAALRRALDALEACRDEGIRYRPALAAKLAIDDINDLAAGTNTKQETK